MKKLSSRKLLRRKILDHLGALSLLLLLIVIWQLYREPIAVPFLKPYIIKALNHDNSDYEVTVDSVNLELVRSIQPIKIIANNVSYKKNDGSFIINAPKTSVSFSIKAIMRGVIAPSSVAAYNPEVYVFTTYGVNQEKKEEFTEKKLKYYFESFEDFMERFNSADKTYPESYIDDIEINNASVEFHEVDLGRKWQLSELNYHFDRGTDNIKTEVNASVNLHNKLASVGLEAAYRFSDDKVAMQFYFSDIIPSQVFDNVLEEDLKKKIYQINLPISGRIETLINFKEVLKHKENIVQSLDSALENVKFQFEGGQGSIMFSESEEYKYDVSSFVLEGSLSSNLDNLKIENAAFDLDGKPTKLSLYVSGMKKYLLESSLKDLKVKLKADVKELAFDELSVYWPKYIASQAWEWCKDSIYGGKAENANFVFDFSYSEKDQALKFDNLSGVGYVSDSNLYYLAGMPHITNLYGKVNFFTDSIKIDIDKGVSEGVYVNGGFVRLYDLDKNDNFAEIRVLANSSIVNALKMIDHEPLGYAKEMGVNPEDFEGTADVDLLLNFEIKENLKPEEVKANVKAALSDVVIKDIFEKKPLEADRLDLEVTNEGLLVEGDAKLDGIPLKLTWDEDFKAKNYQSKYQIALKLDDAVKKQIGLDWDIINDPYIKGHADVVADIVVVNKDKTEIDVSADLTDADIDYSFFGFRKKVGESGKVAAKVRYIKGALNAVPSFSLSKENFNLNGKLELDKGGRVNLIDIYAINGPRTNAQAKIDISNPKHIKIDVSGKAYDMSDFFDKIEDAAPQSSKNKPPRESLKDELEEVTDTDAFIVVNKLWTNAEVPVTNFTGSGVLRKGVGFKEVHMLGNYGGKGSFKLDYAPKPNGEFLLSVESNNAGSTLKVLRAYEHMQGGTLNIEAKRNVDKEFTGYIKVRDFSIHNTPVLAKVLTVASFAGMVDLLKGDGITFSHFDAPIEYRNKILYIKEAKGFGNVLGISADGYYDRYDEILKVKGVIIPAYSLNKMLGKIPVVGTLLAGKDGTIFAADYSIRGDMIDPQVEINPLSALSPNSLKELFSGDDK